MATCLGSQIESKIATPRKRVLDQKRDFVGEAQLDGLGKARRFAEVDEVFERECQGHGFGKFDFNVEIWLLYVAVASKSNGPVANVTIARELDTIFGRFDRYYIESC